MSPRIYFSATILLAALSLLYGFSVFANVDMAPEIVACSKKKHFVQPVTNGRCYGIIIGRGKELVLTKGDGDTVKHRYPQGCGSAEPIDWKENNPEWETKTCAPTYSCLENPSADLTNAAFISAAEQPYQNAPEVNPPIFPLDKDYLKNIVFSDNVAVSDTADLCQYTCNDGYRMVTGPCGSAGSTATGGTATATVTGTAVPTGTNTTNTVSTTVTDLSADPEIKTAIHSEVAGTGTSTNVGNPPVGGWQTIETKTFTGTNTAGKVKIKITLKSSDSANNIYVRKTGTTLTPAQATLVVSNGNPATGTATVDTDANGKFDWYIAGPPQVEARVQLQEYYAIIPGTGLQATITNGGSGYTTAPTVTLSSACPNTVTATATVAGGAVTGITFGGTGTCTAAPTITVSAPTGTTTGTTGTAAVVTATGTTLPLSTDLKATITNGGSGYVVVPAIIFTGCPSNVIATATLTSGVITGVTISGTGPCTSNTHTVTVAPPGGSASNVTGVVTLTGTTVPASTELKATITNGGSGYTTAPTVTLSSACPNTVTATATVAGGAVTGITFGGTGTCTAAPTITVSAPTGTTTGTTGTTTGGTGTCATAPTITIAAPTGTDVGVNATLTLTNITTNTAVTVATQGSGYSTAPTVTVNVPNNGTCSPYTPSIKTVLTGGKVTSASLQVLAPTVEVEKSVILDDTLIFAVIKGGAGYTSAPTVTVGGLTGVGCTLPPAVPHLNNRGELTTIDDMAIPSGCIGIPTVTVSAPPALVANITCPTNTTLTVAEPTGAVTGATATATVALAGTGFNVTVTNGGSGYNSNPAVTVNTTGANCTKTPVGTATVDPATKTVTAVTLGFTGTTAYAISNATGTTAAIPTNGGGAGYTTAPLVTVTGGVCTTRPLATATISAAGVVTGVTLTGAVGCTVAPILTIAPPSSYACTTTGNIDKCIPLVCTGAAPTTALYCENDTVIAGHEDQPRVHRADATQCTSNAKCEWYCPAATPFYCESANTCVTSQNECGQTNTCKTSAPSEIKKELDVPFIQCDTINGTDSHFRYKITKTGGTASDTYISPLFTVGTSVKHPTTFYSGTYTVTCLYGSAANTNATLPDYGMTAGTCTKTMTANDTANGCSRIYPYRGSTLSDELTSASAFDASFRCGSREVVTNTADTKAYRLQVATSDPSFLAYDRNITDLFAGLAIGPVSTQTQSYNFNTGADITCAAKVGDGYSTNSSCQARACVGGACATPQSFIVVPSEEVTCTNQDSISYDVGCNPSSPDYTECLQWMYQDNTNTTNINGVETYNRNAKIKVNNVEQDIYFTCKIETPAGALGPVKTCSIQLPTGGTPVTIFAGDATTTNNTTNYSFQTTAYTLRKDTGKPTGTIAYYTNYSNGVTLSPDQYEYWQKQPITAVITCTDKAATSATGEPTTAGETDGSGCACSQTLTTNNATPTAAEQLEIDQWSLGIPSSNTNIGPDVMTYSRVIANMNNATTTPPAVKVQDSANNKSTQSFQPDFGIDSTPPRLTASKTADSVTLSFVDNTAGDSGIWKFSDNIPVGTGILKGGANNAILYRIGSKNNLAALEFGADCSPLPVKNTNYYKYKEVPAAPGTQTLTLPSFDVNNNIVAYCIQDNAGNINRGYYPNNLMGCFASTAMPTIPTLSPSTLSSHYAPLLKTKFASATLTNNEKYGYSFSENPTNASCFRGILSNNITTLVTNQLNPRPAGETTLDNWTTKLSTIKNTTTPNTNGYYYYTFSANTNNTVTVTPPTGTGTKNVIVDGGNIQINSNIEYTGSGKTLLLIARKNNAGQGGNIYINPTVTRIDAIIIADGGTLINGTTTAGTTTTKNWISNASDLTNRLTINGRLYSYNTRGGSTTPQATPGTDFDPITGNIGKYFDTNSTNATQLITTASPTQAATYDLERLRVMLSDGNSQCTTQVNYQAMTTANLPALLIKPSGFTGGNCSF